MGDGVICSIRYVRTANGAPNTTHRAGRDFCAYCNVHDGFTVWSDSVEWLEQAAAAHHRSIVTGEPYCEPGRPQSDLETERAQPAGMLGRIRAVLGAGAQSR